MNQERSVLDSVESNQNDQFSFVQAEHQILKFWAQKNIFKKSLEKTSQGKPYIFYDGPPFATGLPHHGHLVGSILKDIVPRYFTMKGYYVERRFGWDCHGLPIEHEIDKKLGMSAHDAVKKLGIKGYNDECRSIVQRYTKEWEKTITRIGRWVDFVNDYKTMDITFMESVWWVFKELWDKNLIYQGTKVVPFSTALGTVLSNFEAGLNYQDVQDPAITILFKMDDEDTYISAWTTTPWTLPSNLALCMGAEIDYVKLRDKDLGKTIIMAKARIESYSKKRNYEILSTHKGYEFKGRKYEPLFPYFAHLKKEGAFVILNDDYVTIDNGTGIVHTAPAFGEDDNRVMREAGIKAIVCPVDDAGKFTKEVADYHGQYVKDTDKEIIRTLKSSGQLYDQSTIVHSYPYCYRSDTPLIYKAIPSWYVNVETLKDRLQASNQKINWVPDNIKDGRFGKWLEGARDWAISRNRVWGTPLPVWINDQTGDRKCLGSCGQLEQLTNTKITDLHRESVDNLTFTIKGQAGVYRRIPEVFDCWFESGSMPYAQLHYPFENLELFKNGFPAEFIAEGLDQTRGWFYTLTILSTALFDQPAFKNVIVNGMVLAEDGKKMSKRLKNYTPPDELMETFGADALRLYLITSGLVKAEEQRFADSGVKDMVRRALLPWYNAFKFFQTYAKIDGWDTKKFFKTSENITDRWLISNLQTLKTNISREMEIYRLYNVVPALLTFIEDLTNWYIRLNRSRFWDDQPTEDKWQAYSTLYTALIELSQAMAPFTPFLSEHMYQELSQFVAGGPKEESVHLCGYPIAEERLINRTLEDAVSRMQQVILLGRQKRNQTHIKVKTPLRRLTIINKNEETLREMQKLQHYIKSELNIKTIEYSAKEEQFISFFAKPNSPLLGKKLGKDFGRFKALIEKLPQEDLVQLEETGRITIQGQVFERDEIFVYREALPGTNTLSNRLISIDIDITMDQNLIDEGTAREIVNRIQRTRKDKKLNVEDRVRVWLYGDNDIINAIKKHSSYIMRETLATHISLDLKDMSTRPNALSFDIEGTKLELDLEKA